ncbi:pyridoxamine 5'-phosphate oxidase family protein [Paenibacillus psychroresistens]|uniref:Pyridoxamine 5'-phosphate oxidase family protein n=1 Tax=Paenibacillus psychroresistens TaxID=1778678 RepID=A0A6B8RJ60_9BACL|nr:pyridoxamine 5'-phosphate oxidase family protein [Paenibacillus psychroresistens]QGQ96079.1 pyridoxamine 5'-phosphate oxidase family protein [Paenibacillus psychroresistens]
MFPIRNQKRNCTDTVKIQDFLEHAQTGFLGLSLEDVPYVVPLNFVWLNEAIYFHGADKGRKVTYIEHNPLACFTVSESYGTLTSPIPAATDTAYMSVIIEGSLFHVTDINEATEAMQIMLDKYVPGYYDRPLERSHLERYVSYLGSKTAIYKLTAASLTAKEKEVALDRMFYEGKTVHADRV